MAVINTTGAFSKDYFDDGLKTGLSSYEAYLSGGYLPDRIKPKATAIAQAAKLKAGDRVLDFGCAAGYFVHCFREDMGLDAYGIDVSQDAIDCAPPAVREYLSLRQDKDISHFQTDEFDLVIAKDVLEHIPENELNDIIHELCRIGKKVIVSVPITAVDDGTFIDSIDEQDPTHVIRLTKESWAERFRPKLTPLESTCVALKSKDRAHANFTFLAVK